MNALSATDSSMTGAYAAPSTCSVVDSNSMQGFRPPLSQQLLEHSGKMKASRKPNVRWANRCIQTTTNSTLQAVATSPSPHKGDVVGRCCSSVLPTAARGVKRYGTPVQSPKSYTHVKTHSQSPHVASSPQCPRETTLPSLRIKVILK